MIIGPDSAYSNVSRDWLAENMQQKDAELREARAEIARLTADRDEWHSRALAMFWYLPSDLTAGELKDSVEKAKAFMAELDALRAEVKLLESETDRAFEEGYRAGAALNEQIAGREVKP